MAQPPKKRPFVPSEQDKRRAAELQKKGDELGQPAVASILGVHVRTLQRYIKLERSMKAQHADRFEQHFGRDEFPSDEAARSHKTAFSSESAAALERVLSRRKRELSIAQAEDLRDFAAEPGVAFSEEQWDKMVNTILNGLKALP